MSLKSRFQNLIEIENCENLTQAEAIDQKIKFDVENNKDKLSVELEVLKLLSKKIGRTPVWNNFDEKKQRELIKSFIFVKLSSDFKDFNFSENEKNTTVEKAYTILYGETVPSQKSNYKNLIKSRFVV